jgi:hypothetical protein
MAPTPEIGLYGGMALLISSITGPGLTTIPLLFQQAGWFTFVHSSSLLHMSANLLNAQAYSSIPSLWADSSHSIAIPCRNHVNDSWE